MPPEETTQRTPLRVMTYNIHGWDGADHRLDVSRLAQVIRSARADIVTLNEVIHPVSTGAEKRELLAELASRLDMNYAFGPSDWVDHYPNWSGPLGNAILSRYPLTGVQNTLLPKPSRTKQRSLLEARLGAGPARGLIASVTHLDHAFEGTRMVQLKAVLRHLRHHGPHFLAGDFNTPGFPGARTRYLMPPILLMMRRAGYLDAFHVAGQGRGHTFPAQMPLVRIDYLFLPARWAPGLQSTRVHSMHMARHASDHRPVIAEWTWPEGHAGLVA
jgi:endonuclease/exonuclease/phosphatase family metal-dependent hydrolase